MPDWFWFIVFLAAYIVLMRWVLPRLACPPEWEIPVTPSLGAKLPSETKSMKKR